MKKPIQKSGALNRSQNKLYKDVSEIIEISRGRLLGFANTTTVMVFWQVGNRVLQEVLKNKRAEYGKQIVTNLSEKLQTQYGRNFEEKNLRRMLQFVEQFPSSDQVFHLSKHLSWSHFLALFPLKSDERKHYYAERCQENQWGVRELREAISKKDFERNDLAQTRPTPFEEDFGKEIFKDPYIFDFLELNKGFLEKDLESAIIKDIMRFMMEMGKGFAFVDRQKRIIIDGEDYYLDLLFYHRKLKRLVAIDLKIGKFQARDKGQMELYLKWLDRHEKSEGEERPIGLILCTETSKEQIELLELHKDGILVAEYWTEMPSKNEMELELKHAMHRAKLRLSEAS